MTQERDNLFTTVFVLYIIDGRKKKRRNKATAEIEIYLLEDTLLFIEDIIHSPVSRRYRGNKPRFVEE